MKPTALKRDQFNTPSISLQTALSNYSFYYQLPKNFLSSFPLLPSCRNNNLLLYKKNNQSFLYALKMYQPYYSSPIDSKRASNFLFVVCCRAIEEIKAKTGVVSEKSLKLKIIPRKKNFDIDDLLSRNKNY